MTAANRHDWMLRAEQRAERHAANRAEHDRVRAEAMEKIHAAGRELRQHKGAIRRAARLMDKANPARALGVPDRRLMTDTELAAWTRALLEAERYDWPATARPEQRQPEDYQTWAVISGRGYGKEAPLATPVPTPSGWSTMGDLQVGDEVFDEAGKPCRVTFVTQPRTPTVAYEFTFSDGARITSGGDHQWVTWTHRDRKQFMRYNGNPVEFPENWPAFTDKLLGRWGNVTGHYGPTIKTSDEIVATLEIGARGDSNHCIPLAGALDLSDADLPLDPWLLGYWLGNGANRGGVLAAGSYQGDMDERHVEHMVHRAGFAFRTKRLPERGHSLVSVYGLMAVLKDMGLLRNKHVPAAYLRASITQRRLLLAGLLDSDGYIDERPSMVEFCSMERRLADAVLELARSLGERPTLGVGRATLYGVDHGAKYRVCWRPRQVSGFTLPRKAEKWSPPGAQGLRLAHRMIKSYAEVEPVPMRCITVDSPNSMYLIGEAMIPTHNTRLSTEAIREWCSVPNQRVAIVAKDHKSLRDVNFDGVSGLIPCVPPGDLKPGSYKRGLGDVSIEFTNGSIVYGFGLALDTPIPTPAGWAKMGDLRDGDFVFDEAGRPCRVMNAWPEYEPERMYRLAFSDGSTLEADGDHLWTTWAHLDKENLMRLNGAMEFPTDWPAFREPLHDSWGNVRGSYGPAVRTTDQIAATLTHPHATRVVRNHCVPLAGALELPEIDLPLDPWVLGYWLGNGETKQARLACDPNDRPEISQHLAEFQPHGNPAYPIRIDTRGLMTALRVTGVLHDKHVPAVYLRASLDQRLALLQGLMDSDGHASARGHDVQFSNINRHLIDAVFELALSLGERPSITSIFASKTSYGVFDGWKVSWTPRNQVPFRLTRKAERVSPSSTLKTRYRSIVSCDPIEPHPVRCITVASPNQMYLAGETFIPTHNTSEAPDSIRGRAFDAAVADEYAAWGKNKAQDMLDQLRLCLRDSARPRVIITTTPKRVPHVIELVKLAEAGEPGMVLTRGKTSDNTALSQVARDMLERMYGGTRIGRQELDGILLTDVDNALFLAEMIEGARWTSDDDFPPMVGVITGVDPSGSETGDATGIVTCGWDKNKVIYVLENRSTRGTPAHRYSEVCRSARRWGAGEIWSESAFSGDSSIYGIEQQWKNLLDSGEFPDGSVCPRVRPSTIKGDKAARAMSVVALYEQQLVTGRARIWHPVPTVGNGIALLEEECLSWSTDSKKSPNAIDALVHAVRQIMRRTGQESVASSAARSKRRIFGGYKPF